MHYQDQQLISYLENENVSTVNLSIFKKNKPIKVVKDIESISEKVNKVKSTLPKKIIKPKPEKQVVKKNDSIVDRRVRPLNIDFLLKKNDVTWL